MKKLDLTKEDKAYYTAKLEPEVLFIDKAQFLSISGKGDPSGDQFANNLQALYATAYGLKFLYKAEGKDFLVPKLEGLWSFDDSKYENLSIDTAPLLVPRSEWNYKMLIRMPGYVTLHQTKGVIDVVVNKKQILMAKNAELCKKEEGKVVQMLHVGPFSSESQTLKKCKNL